MSLGRLVVFNVVYFSLLCLVLAYSELFSFIVCQVSEPCLVSLERLLVLLVEQHPKLHPKLHFICYVAVVKVYVAVSRHATVFPDFLSRTGQY